MELSIYINSWCLSFFWECPALNLMFCVLLITSRLQKDKKGLMLSFLDILIGLMERVFICVSHYVPKILKKLVIWFLLCIRIDLLTTAMFMFIVERQEILKESHRSTLLHMDCFTLFLAIMTLTSSEKEYLARALKLQLIPTKNIQEPFRRKLYKWVVYRILFLALIIYALVQTCGIQTQLKIAREVIKLRSK